MDITFTNVEIERFLEFTRATELELQALEGRIGTAVTRALKTRAEALFDRIGQVVEVVYQRRASGGVLGDLDGFWVDLFWRANEVFRRSILLS